jgi:hypothetical protein
MKTEHSEGKLIIQDQPGLKSLGGLVANEVRGYLGQITEQSGSKGGNAERRT